MLVEQFAKFVLERSLAMMLFLIIDVCNRAARRRNEAWESPFIRPFHRLSGFSDLNQRESLGCCHSSAARTLLRNLKLGNISKHIFVSHHFGSRHARQTLSVKRCWQILMARSREPFARNCR